jgi:hypothetical protein
MIDVRIVVVNVEWMSKNEYVSKTIRERVRTINDGCAI